MSSDETVSAQCDAAGDVQSEVSGTKLEDKGEDAASSMQETEGDAAGPTQEESENKTEETVSFKVIYNKQKLDVTFPLHKTVSELKEHLQGLTSVPVSMQKVMHKGLMMKDQSTLSEQKVSKSSKLMLVGSTVTDILSVSAPDPKALKEEEKKEAAANKEAFSKQKPHKTVLEKHGKPDDALVGIKNRKDRLPTEPLTGMYNKSGGKVRLTFKLEVDQLWIGTKERTEKIPMGSIKAVVSEPIDGNEDYHLMGIQLGPTEASRYWVYWVPAQYVDAIKDSILGKWQFF